MNEEQADAVDKAFDPDYDVAQVFCSHIVPKVLILFVEESPNDGMEFEPYYGEVDDNDKDEGGGNKGGEGTGLPFPASEKTTGEWW